MATTVYKRIRFRQNNHASAVSNNEVLRSGEPFFETDTGEFKIGDGTTQYKKLLGVRSEAEIAEQIAQGIYAGTDLSVKFADEIAAAGSVAQFLHARCAANNFKGIYPGDYWYETTSAGTVAGTSVPQKNRKCVIAGIDLYYNTGDNPTMPHHITVFAGFSDFNIAYNDINSNNGSSNSPHPWLASKLYAVLNGVNNVGTNNQGTIGYNASSGGYLQLFSATIRGFMQDRRVFLGQRYSAGQTLTDDNSQNWANMGKLFAPSEVEVYGTMVHSAKDGIQSENYGPWCHWPVFANAGQTRGRLLFGRTTLWLSSVCGGSPTNACVVNGNGTATNGYAYNTFLLAPLCFHLA